MAIDDGPALRPNTLYEQDFYAWTQEQARLLRERRWEDLDLENLAEEVESVGSSERREIRNRITVLLAHLLKWTYQPGHRGASWRATIFEQRDQLAEIGRGSPSLQGYIEQQAVGMYRSGKLLASKETGLSYSLFPDDCPFSPGHVLDQEFLPEDPSKE